MAATPPLLYRGLVFLLEILCYHKIIQLLLAFDSELRLRSIGHACLACLTVVRCTQLLVSGAEPQRASCGTTATAVSSLREGEEEGVSVVESVAASSASNGATLVPVSRSAHPPRAHPDEARAFAEAIGSEQPPVFLPYQRLPPEATKVYERVDLVLGWSFDSVREALEGQYTLGPPRGAADLLQPAVVSIEELRRERFPMPSGLLEGTGEDPDGGASTTRTIHLLSQRVVLGLDELPAMLRQLSGASQLTSVIDTVIHDSAEQRVLFAFSRNANLHDIGQFQECAKYAPHPTDARYTLYSSRVTVLASTWLGRRVMAFMGGDGLTLIQAHLDLLRARLREKFGDECTGLLP